MEQNAVAAWWAKMGKDVHDGYKNHVKADRTSKRSEDDEVTDARVHDSQTVEDLVGADDESVYADSAYTGETIETIHEQHGVKSEMCEKRYRNHPVPKVQKKRTRTKRSIRDLSGA